MRKASKVSRKVMKFVADKAAEWKVPMPDNAEDILRGIQEQSDTEKGPVRFAAGSFGDRLNANAKNMVRRYTIISPAWAAVLVLKDSADARNAFMATIGHEAGHAIKFHWPFLHMPYPKFYCWLNETYADFYARKEFLKGDTDAEIRAMQFKRNYNVAKNSKKDGNGQLLPNKFGSL